MLVKLSGVYRITCRVNNRTYVGSSKDITRRRYAHFYLFRKNIHPNIHMQRAWNKHGEESFSFTIIEECAPSQEILLTLEQKYIDSEKPLFNIRKNAFSREGAAQSHETRAKISAANKGRIVSEETRRKIGVAHKGKTIPPEMRARISKALAGIPRTNEGGFKKGHIPWHKGTKGKLPPWNKGDARPRTLCSVEGCGRLNNCYGLCTMHDRRMKKHGSLEEKKTVRTVCKIEGCGRPNVCYGICNMHNRRLTRHGSLEKPSRSKPCSEARLAAIQASAANRRMAKAANQSSRFAVNNYEDTANMALHIALTAPSGSPQ